MAETEATHVGFYFGPLNGRFYKPLHKCQDAEMLWKALADGYGRLSFPVGRCLFLSGIGALYAAEQNLGKILKGAASLALPHQAALSKWWEARLQEIHKCGELLHFLRALNNSDKHGAPSVPTGLRPIAKYVGEKGQLIAVGSEYMGDTMGFRMAAEGLFQSLPFAGGYEKWTETDDDNALARLSCQEAHFTFEILGLPKQHLGKEHGKFSPPDVLRVAIDYHYELVRKAIDFWREAPEAK